MQASSPQDRHVKNTLFITVGLSTHAAVVENDTIDKRSRSPSKAMMVVIACLTTSKMDKPCDYTGKQEKNSKQQTETQIRSSHHQSHKLNGKPYKAGTQ